MTQGGPVIELLVHDLPARSSIPRLCRICSAVIVPAGSSTTKVITLRIPFSPQSAAATESAPSNMGNANV
jgi:hypothetical protein